MRVEAAGVLVVLLFAGCTSGGEGSSSPPLVAIGDSVADGTANETENVTQVPLPPPILYGGGCALDAAVFAVPASEAAQGLPSGFRPAPMTNVSLADLAQVVVGVMACDNQTWNGTEFGPTLTSFQFVIVLPPPEMADEANITLNFFGRMATADETIASVFEGWNMGEAGTVTNGETATPAVRAGQFAATVPGFSYQATTETAANTGVMATVLSGAPEGEATYRFFSAPDGAVSGWVDITFGASREWFGSCTSTFSGGSGAFAHPALAGVGIYRHNMELVSSRYVPLPVLA